MCVPEGSVSCANLVAVEHSDGRQISHEPNNTIDASSFDVLHCVAACCRCVVRTLRNRMEAQLGRNGLASCKLIALDKLSPQIKL